MKPGFAAAAVPAVGATSPWIPIVIGAAAAGTLVYFATRDKDDPTSCDFTVEASVTPASCGLSNGSIQLTTSVMDSIAYDWSTGQTTPSLQQVAAGQYQVTITRTGTTCTQMLSVTVPDEQIQFSVTLTTTNSECGQATGTASTSVDPAGEYTWQWSNGASTPEISNLSPGAYSVSVSAGGNCTRTATGDVLEEPFDPAISVTTTPADCGQTNGTASVSVDPPGEYTFTWSNGATGASVSDLSPGSYAVTVAIAGTSCEKSVNAEITENEATFSLSISATQATCGQADGSATVTVDPPGEYTYAWSNGQGSAQATGLLPGQYTVTVTLAGTTCSQEINATVDELPPDFSLSVSSTPSRCGTMEGTASVTVDPPGEYTYAWTGGQTTPSISELLPGVYSVTVSIAGTTCAISIDVVVEELPPTFMTTFSTTPADCNQSNGGATATVDPPGEYTYLWSTGAAGPVLSDVPAGMYMLTVTLAGTACALPFEVVIEQAGINFTGDITPTNSACGLSTGTATADVTPAGEYTYAWSNDQTGSVLENVPAGSYSLTVTDTSGCSLTLQVEIGEDPPVHIVPGSITPGSCVGGGDISFTLVTAGAGPIELQVNGPGGSINVTLPAGAYLLSAFLQVNSGAHTFVAYDQGAGAGCTETIELVVPDSTPPLVANDDFYQTTGGEPVAGNMLDNDSGPGLIVTDVTAPFGGVVTWTPNGDFVFTPEPGFSGDGGFTYTVMDACGRTATAEVIIEIQAGICDFEVTFTTMPANCGLADGVVSAVPNPQGSYLYAWSNGVSGPVIADVPSGAYTLTVTDLNLGCDLIFDAFLPENPPDYIEDVTVIQPACGENGEISFTVLDPGGAPLAMYVEHPNGFDLFFIEPGLLTLSEYIDITGGSYTIEIGIEGGDPDCVESYTTTLEATGSPVEIIAEAVFPPSTPSAMDGTAIIVALSPGELPYEILVDGMSYGVAIAHVFEVGGLGAGPHTIQIVDALGCASNILDIFVPLPTIGLSLNGGWQTGPVYEGQPEQPVYTGQAFGFVLGASLTRWYPRWGQEANLSWMPGMTRSPGRSAELLQAEYLFKPLPWYGRRHALSLKGGPAVRYVPEWRLIEPFLVVRSALTLKVMHDLSVTASFGAEAGMGFIRPTAGLQVSLPIRLPAPGAPISSMRSPLDFSLFER